MIREMGELTIERYHIAQCIDMFHIGTAICICYDTSFISLDRGFIECESLSIGNTTECEEDMRIRYT